jgi:hypothetical protein
MTYDTFRFSSSWKARHNVLDIFVSKLIQDKDNYNDTS